ncbi:MAG: mechanosensitive ion channel [Myxococcales bacterium]|nr:mechanosensitive ion channel [Myxococcales bacterium]
MDVITEWLAQLRAALQIDLFDISGTRITVMTALTAMFTIAVTFVVSRVVRKLLRRAFALRGATDERTIGAVASLTHYVVLFIGFGISLQTIGINLSALFAAGAVFAVAIGFAMQTVTQSFVAGVILLGERTIRPGDVLVIDGTIARVQRLGIRATVVETLDGEFVLVPNDTLVREKIKNLTYEHTELRVNVTVGVAFGSDLQKTTEVLSAAAARVQGDRSTRPHAVFVEEIGESRVVFRVAAWTNEPWGRPKFASALRTEVWGALKDAGITVAYPQLDVHLDRERLRAAA